MVHGPAAVMLSGPAAVIDSVPGASAIVFPLHCNVMLVGVRMMLVGPTCRTTLVGDIAWMPAGDSMTVWCGPTGDGGDGIAAGTVGPVWIVTEAGVSVKTT
jgi:hypothetical protein